MYAAGLLLEKRWDENPINKTVSEEVWLPTKACTFGLKGAPDSNFVLLIVYYYLLFSTSVLPILGTGSG